MELGVAFQAIGCCHSVLSPSLSFRVLSPLLCSELLVVPCCDLLCFAIQLHADRVPGLPLLCTASYNSPTLQLIAITKMRRCLDSVLD